MRLFISYPREFEESAKTIYWELQSRGFLNVFLDSETLHVGDNWKEVIGAQIRKADVLIILYHHGAARDKSRYFCTELGHHVKEECKNNGKLIITVLFPPTAPKNLPTYLAARHVIETTTDGIDHGSIEMVIGGVQRWEAERREAERREAERQKTERQEAERQEAERRKSETRRDIQRKYTPVFSLLIAAIVILTGIVIFIQSKPPHDSPNNGTESPSNDPWAVSKKTCEELLNVKQYDLWGSYTLIEDTEEEKQGIRATTKAGKWVTVNCEKIAEPVGTYILHGQEETKHEVRVKINDKYKYVVDAKNKSLSELTINKEGVLVDRRISYPPDGEFHGIPTIKEVNTTENFWKERRSYIKEKLEKYKERVRKLHEKAEKTMHCVPTRGKTKDNRELIAFTCVIDPSSSDDPKYTRVMKQN